MASPFCEIDGVFAQSFALPLCLGTRNALPAAHRLDSAFQVRPRSAVLFEDPPCLAFVFCQRKQKELGRDELVTLLLGFLIG